MTSESAAELLRPASGSILSTKDVPPIPWKNGAGTTREIAAFTGTGSVADFRWRISVADLTRDAPFSRFPGIDRTFLIASGAGVVLEVAGTATSLNRGESVTFSGEDEVTVALPQGPATAVNLMTARSHCGVMTVLPIDGERAITPATVAVLVLEGSARTSTGETLQPMDFWLSGADVQTVHFREAVAVFIDILTR